MKKFLTSIYYLRIKNLYLIIILVMLYTGNIWAFVGGDSTPLNSSVRAVIPMARIFWADGHTTTCQGISIGRFLVTAAHCLYGNHYSNKIKSLLPTGIELILSKYRFFADPDSEFSKHNLMFSNKCLMRYGYLLAFYEKDIPYKNLASCDAETSVGFLPNNKAVISFYATSKNIFLGNGGSNTYIPLLKTSYPINIYTVKRTLKNSIDVAIVDFGQVFEDSMKSRGYSSKVRINLGVNNNLPPLTVYSFGGTIFDDDDDDEDPDYHSANNGFFGNLMEKHIDMSNISEDDNGYLVVSYKENDRYNRLTFLKGDSGSPLLSWDNDIKSYILYGILNHVINDASLSSAYFYDIRSVYSWMENILTGRAIDANTTFTCHLGQQQYCDIHLGSFPFGVGN